MIRQNEGDELIEMNEEGEKTSKTLITNKEAET